MIEQYFGIKTLDFVKYLILIAFIFFFLRLVNLMITALKDNKNKNELKKLFYVTEILIWATFSAWIYFMIPNSKIIFFIISAIFIALNTLIWFKIKLLVAGIFVRLAFSLKINEKIKFNNNIVKISDLKAEYLTIDDNGQKNKIKYLDFIKNKIQLPVYQTISFDKQTEKTFKNIYELKDILKENNFTNDETFVNIKENNNKILLEICAFDEKNIKKIKKFLAEISK
jgi:hypothetical protein